MPVAILKKKQHDPAKNIEHILPRILQTPSGLALLEIQGSIHVGNKMLASIGGLGLESVENEDIDMENKSEHEHQVEDEENGMDHIGEFDFSDIEAGGSQVTLRIGQFQRLRGKLVKLKSPLAVLRIDPKDDSTTTQESLDEKRRSIGQNKDAIVEIPVLDIIYQKILFSTRPEPIVYG